MHVRQLGFRGHAPHLRQRLTIARAFGQHRLPEVSHLGLIATLGRQGGQVPPGGMPVDPLVSRQLSRRPMKDFREPRVQQRKGLNPRVSLRGGLSLFSMSGADSMASAERQDTPECTSDGSTWSSAPKLARKVRELTQRSFHALKSGPMPDAQAPPRSNEVQQDLHDLRHQVARLQRKIHDRNLGALIPWIDALRQEVENRLGTSGKADK
jgi:hypothetical protein